MAIARFTGALHGRVRRDRIGAGVRFFAVFGELDRDVRLVLTDNRIGDAIARIRAEIRVQVPGETDARDVGNRVGVHRGVGDFLVDGIVLGKDRAGVLVGGGVAG